MNIKRIGSHRLPLPTKATERSAGFDLFACFESPYSEQIIAPGETMIIPTGFAWGFESYTMGMICSRSGLAAKHGVFVSNAPGIIDSDYVGEAKVILFNSSNKPFTVMHGDRIAQMLVRMNVTTELEEVESLPETARGSGGLGSTGVS